jgi:hypothetical protein
MPRLSSFYGIAIYMYFRDHAPPHFHAIYGENDAMIDIATGDIIRGELPRRAAKLAMEWTLLHRAELNANWTAALVGDELTPIAPLD